MEKKDLTNQEILKISLIISGIWAIVLYLISWNFFLSMLFFILVEFPLCAISAFLGKYFSATRRSVWLGAYFGAILGLVLFKLIIYFGSALMGQSNA